MNESINLRSIYGYFACSITIIYSLWIVDDVPRFLFDDSHSYLSTRWHGYLPNDRSWIYGLAIYWLMRVTGSLSSVLLLQGALYAAVLSVFAVFLVRITRAPWVGYLFCAIAILDPLAVYLVRNILSDLPAASIFLLVLLAFYQVLFAENDSRKHLVVAIGLLVVAITILLMLRVAYLPTVLALCFCFFILSLCRHFGIFEFVHALAPRIPRVLAATTAIIFSIFAVETLNYKLNPIMGFTLNGRASAFSIGLLAPAIRYEMLEQEGFTIDRATFDGFHVSDIERRNANLFVPQGLVETLVRQMRGLSENERESRFRKLHMRILRENPLGVARVFAHQFLVQINPVEYIGQFYKSGLIDHRIFAENFVEKFINPNVWQKIERTLPRQPTLSEKYLASSGIVVWLQYIFAIISPLGLFLVSLPARRMFAIISFAACAYAVSTIIFAMFLIPRYFLPIGLLSAALLLLLIASIAPRVMQAKWALSRS